MGKLTIPRHRVFLSFHHANDEEYKLRFEDQFHETEKILHSRSVNDGNIDPRLPAEIIRKRIRDEYLGDSTVTVVLVGTETWRRKHVDWEIASSLRDMAGNRRSGLVGLLLPSRRWRNDLWGIQPTIMPQRLMLNVDCGYVKLYHWTDDPQQMARIIHEAWARRTGLIAPKLGPAMLHQNIANTMKGWGQT